MPELEKDLTTKRYILSAIARLFDPLGLISPIIVTAKLLMQRLWELHIDWDAEIPTELKVVWEEFCTQLVCLKSIKIPRHLLLDKSTLTEIHGFVDASATAYGACLYMRSINANGEVLTRLIASKSRIAPLKTTTIPRLELCAALLLSRLYRKIVHSFREVVQQKTYLWSDSTIVLCWLKKGSRSFKTFVSVRIAEIQESTVGCAWKYVNSNDSPADIGVNNEQIMVERTLVVVINTENMVDTTQNIGQ